MGILLQCAVATGGALRICSVLSVSVETMESMPAVEEAARIRPIKTDATPMGGAPA